MNQKLWGWGQECILLVSFSSDSYQSLFFFIFSEFVLTFENCTKWQTLKTLQLLASGPGPGVWWEYNECLLNGLIHIF